MSTKSKHKPELIVVSRDRHTDAVIRRYLLETGGDQEDEVAIPLKIKSVNKNGIRFSKDQIEYLVNSKDQVLGGKLDYIILSKSRAGRFLNLPRKKFQKKDDKAQSENKRLNKQIQDMVAKKDKK